MSDYKPQEKSKLQYKLWFKSKGVLKRFEQQSRALTAGENEMAKSVFGNSIELSNVRLKTAWWVLKNYAVSPNGNIYFHHANWLTDFSQATLGKQSWLIHELTHVWQWQQGLKVVRGALINRRYSYKLIVGKSFFKYGIEQQARMVQDYFIRRQLGQKCDDLASCIPFLQAQAEATNFDNSNNKDDSANI